jgi:hypothetical protein
MTRLDYMAALTQLHGLKEGELDKVSTFIFLYAEEGQEQPGVVSYKDFAKRYKELMTIFQSLKSVEKHIKEDVIEIMAIYNLFRGLMN